jgi:membrane protein DedA with SNARE-associated domain
MHIVGDLAHVLLHFFYAHELVTLFVALLIEEAGVPLPIPGDALLMLAGAASQGLVWSDAAAIVVCSSAVFLGSSTLYSVMHRGGRPLLRRYGKYVHLSPHTLGRLECWFVRRGRVTIIVGRLIPGLRIPTTVTAGISGIPATSYLITAAIAAPVWSSMFYLLGAVLGRQGPLFTVMLAGLLHAVPRWLLVLSAVLIVVGVGGGLWELRRHRRLQHVEA